MTTISAKTILRSRNSTAPDKVLSTLLLRYPRPIHSEFMTHRVFSRNAASSRAIPIKKLIDDVVNDPFVPLHWGKNEKGMQANEECSDPVFAPVPMPFGGPRLELVQNRGRTNREAWLNARDLAVMSAKAFAAAGYHKQIVNRLLEPFAHITVLVSSTEWDNFLELRDHADAEPHIQMLAREVRKCLEDDSTIQLLHPGEWHLPFVTEEDWAEADAFGRHLANVFPNKDEPRDADTIAMDNLIKLSTARCASTSYKTVDGFDMTMERAIAVHDKLVGSRPIHASPAEHVAQVDKWMEGHDGGWLYPEQHANFVGFRQYRHMLPTT